MIMVSWSWTLDVVDNGIISLGEWCDGQEIPVSLVYDQVKVAAKFSQQDCKLDRLLEGLEEEEVFESK